MIQRENDFSKNEQELINAVDSYFYLFSHCNMSGRVFYREDAVRFEIKIGDKEREVVLQFCVRDNEEIEYGYENFVYISNILIPSSLSRQGIANGLITFMSQVANKVLNLSFYIVNVVNEGWKKSLIMHGGIEDENGDIKITYDNWSKCNKKYGVAYLNSKGEEYKEGYPFIQDCCCREELILVMINAKNTGYEKLIPFAYDKQEDTEISWEYADENQIDIYGLM